MDHHDGYETQTRTSARFGKKVLPLLMAHLGSLNVALGSAWSQSEGLRAARATWKS